MKPLRNILILFATLAVAATSRAAQPAKPFSGEVVKVSDVDTYVVKRSDGEPVKVRLHWADGPEVAHRKSEVDQPEGQRAAEFASEWLLNRSVTVQPVGESYGRIVGDVSRGDIDVAWLLVRLGMAQCDPRYKPSKILREAETKAREDKLGIWSDPEQIPPWEWRKLTREEQIKRRARGE